MPLKHAQLNNQRTPGFHICARGGDPELQKPQVKVWTRTGLISTLTAVGQTGHLQTLTRKSEICQQLLPSRSPSVRRSKLFFQTTRKASQHRQEDGAGTEFPGVGIFAHKAAGFATPLRSVTEASISPIAPSPHPSSSGTRVSSSLYHALPVRPTRLLVGSCPAAARCLTLFLRFVSDGFITY